MSSQRIGAPKRMPKIISSVTTITWSKEPEREEGAGDPGRRGHAAARVRLPSTSQVIRVIRAPPAIALAKAVESSSCLKCIAVAA